MRSYPLPISYVWHCLLYRLALPTYSCRLALPSRLAQQHGGISWQAHQEGIALSLSYLNSGRPHSCKVSMADPLGRSRRAILAERSRPRAPTGIASQWPNAPNTVAGLIDKRRQGLPWSEKARSREGVQRATGHSVGLVTTSQ